MTKLGIGYCVASRLFSNIRLCTLSQYISKSFCQINQYSRSFNRLVLKGLFSALRFGGLADCFFGPRTGLVVIVSVGTCEIAVLVLCFVFHSCGCESCFVLSTSSGRKGEHSFSSYTQNLSASVDTVGEAVLNKLADSLGLIRARILYNGLTYFW